MKLNSKVYDIEYDMNSEIFETGLKMDSQKAPFSIDVEENLTNNDDFMNEFWKNIDNIEVIKTRIFDQVHDIYKTHQEDKESIDFFLEFYIEDIDEEYHPEIFGITVEELKNWTMVKSLIC